MAENWRHHHRCACRCSGNRGRGLPISLPPNKVLAKVGNEKINVTQFEEAVRYQRTNMISNYNYMAQLYQAFGMPMDENTKSTYTTQLSKEYAPIIGQQVYNTLIDQIVLNYGAKEAGISVSDEELDSEMRSMWGYFPDGTPTPAPTNEPFASTPTVSDAQKAILNYTETPTATAEADELTSLEESGPLPAAEVATETPTVAPSPLPTETTVADPTPTLTPTLYTEEMYKANVDRQFVNNKDYSKEFFRKQLYYQELQRKVQDFLAKDIPTEADMVWARHILVATEDEAKKVIERLDAGEEWNALAAELSIDTSNKDKGGDLGWFMQGAMVKPFENAAFEQEIGTHSKEPIMSDYGFHIIQIVGHEIRPLTQNDRDTMIRSAYDSWITDAKSKLKVETNSDWVNFVPTEPELNLF